MSKLIIQEPCKEALKKLTSDAIEEYIRIIHEEIEKDEFIDIGPILSIRLKRIKKGIRLDRKIFVNDYTDM